VCFAGIVVPETLRARVALLLAVTAACAAVLVALAALGGGDDGPAEGQLAPGRAPAQDEGVDPLAWAPQKRAALESAAAAGYSHVLYAKSPGGAGATAARVARFRPLVEEVAEANDLDADVLEAIVFLESAGRPDARASDDLSGAVGLTQILAETGQNLLDMRIDVEASERLTRGIARGRRVAARTRARARVDERFDPRKALEGTARYLKFAKQQLGRDDLAVVSYHMGVGNLQTALERYGDEDIPYAQLFFDVSPLRKAAAWRFLSSLGDDSSTYLWRVYAARRIMALWRHSPAEVANVSSQQLAKASAEEVLHPRSTATVFEDADAVEEAREGGALRGLVPADLRERGLRIDPRMGELGGRAGTTAETYRALRPEALALLLYLGEGVQDVADDERATLKVTSTVRDERYQRLLVRSGNGEATRGFSLHTTGYAFDVAREYRSRAQARAFQFWLDRLQAHDLIAWVREPGAIHVTVSRRAQQLVRATLG
jgi:hypothetical protein